MVAIKKKPGILKNVNMKLNTIVLDKVKDTIGRITSIFSFHEDSF